MGRPEQDHLRSEIGDVRFDPLTHVRSGPQVGPFVTDDMAFTLGCRVVLALHLIVAAVDK